MSQVEYYDRDLDNVIVKSASCLEMSLLEINVVGFDIGVIECLLL